jgi:hypothetical protein
MRAGGNNMGMKFILLLILAPSSYMITALNHTTFSGIEPLFASEEAFSGAWFGSVANILDQPNLNVNRLGFNKKKRIMCETASDVFFNRMMKWDGSLPSATQTFGDAPGQTVDMFDFSVLHLSSGERLFNKSIIHLMPLEVR